MKNPSKTRLEKFKEAARELETDNDESRISERLKNLANQEPDSKEDKASGD